MTWRNAGAVALISLFGAVTMGTAHAQDSKDGLWASEAPVAAARATRTAGPPPQAVYRLNKEVLERILAVAPAEGAVARGADVEITVPSPDGAFLRFRIEQSSIMEPELARKYPEIATFRGQGAGDASSSIRFSRTPLGFKATIVQPDGVFIVAPQSLGDTTHYVVERIEGGLGEMFECLVGAFAPGAEGSWAAIGSRSRQPASTRAISAARSPVR